VALNRWNVERSAHARGYWDFKQPNPPADSRQLRLPPAARGHTIDSGKMTMATRASDDGVGNILEEQSLSRRAFTGDETNSGGRSWLMIDLDHENQSTPAIQNLWAQTVCCQTTRSSSVIVAEEDLSHRLADRVALVSARDIAGRR